ncbi:MAG: phosphoribosyl-AMP cyclohydrolase [Lutibacter sp.]|nr:phosphoribosyl-AMP cyclohydrolase [Lutibacter sp.]
MKIKVLNTKINSMFVVAITLATAMTLSFSSCRQTAQEKQDVTTVQTKSEPVISEQEVLDAQKKWGEGIVNIGKIYLEKGDYKTAASNHIDEYYGYNMGIVLFKPTLVFQKQFRIDKEGALSYFISENPSYVEDHGFAIKPWSNVRWESAGIKIIGNMAVAMGNYYFTPAKGGEDVKVEYSFAYTKDENGNLRIILHDSHLPYAPAEKH